ncbi:MAG TPA: metallophosphoesterase family protein [Acidimicrobiia bacterium]|nr:metallophosphoesterase family protein [Acidimicrobiia bacterium]
MTRSRALVFGALVAFSVVAAGCLARTPYPTDATTTSERINFATADQNAVPVVTFGPSPSCSGSSVNATLVSPITVGSNTEYQWSAALTGLTANTSYCYHLTQGSTDLQNGAPGTFTTAVTPGATTPFSFAVIGDFGGGTPDETNVLSRVRASNASFVVSVGDNAYPDGTQSDYGDIGDGNVFNLDDWPLGGQTKSWFLAQGNHGFDISQPYLQNFPETSAVTSSGGRMQQDQYCCIPAMQQTNTFASAWYAFNWGNARFYVLEVAWSDNYPAFEADFEGHWNGPVPGCAACGAELQWLKSDLAAHASTPLKFAFFHYPLHSDGGDGSDTYLDGPNGLEGLLASNGVNIVFNGHTHDYERNTPQIAGTSMVSYIDGTGGADFISKVQGCSSFDAYAIGASGTSCNAPAPSSDSQVYGFLLVSVNGNTVTVTPTNENGGTFDVQTYHF